MKVKTVLQPEYMERFSCIGPSCEDSCCVGWRVTVDEASYKKYSKATDETLVPLFKKNVTRNRSNPSKTNYAKIKMDSQGRCPFLNEEKLCNIQQKLGATYLSDTCAIYPRTINQIDNIIEKSGTLSCPEIVRLALLNPDGITFNEIEEPISERTFVHSKKEPNSLKNANRIEKYFWDLRIFTIEVLQHRDYAIDERLIFLGLFYQKAQVLLDDNKLDEIQMLIGTYKQLLGETSVKHDLANVPSNPGIQMKLSKELMDQRIAGGINNERYMNCLGQYLNGIRYYKDSSVEENASRYTEAYATYYAPYMKDHEYIYENYLVNYAFRKLFPLTTEGSLFDAYVMMVVHFAMVKLHLIGLAGFHKGLTEEVIVKLIQSFTRMVEHNEGYLKRIHSLLKENDYTTMPFMSILIKN